MSAVPIAPISGQSPTAVAASATAAPTFPAPSAAPGGFAHLLLQGVDQVNQKVLDADRMVQAFAVDDSVPLHQVTFALEQARLGTEFMLQVRSRLLEGYQDIMRMQL